MSNTPNEEVQITRNQKAVYHSLGKVYADLSNGKIDYQTANVLIKALEAQNKVYLTEIKAAFLAGKRKPRAVESTYFDDTRGQASQSGSLPERPMPARNLEMPNDADNRQI